MREYSAPATYDLDEGGIPARLPWRRAAERPHHVSFEKFDTGEWHAITAKSLAAGSRRPPRGPPPGHPGGRPGRDHGGDEVRVGPA